MDLAKLDHPDLQARILERVIATVRTDERFETLLVELRVVEPPSSPVSATPGLLLDLIDGKQSRA